MDILEFTKKVVESYIQKGEIISPPNDLPKELYEKKAGIFVTIMKDKELRGCIGTSVPTKKNIAEEIVSNAIAAATEDYRFGPIKKEELSNLSYEVYILNEPELIEDIKELDPKKFGIIVKTMPMKISTGIDVLFDGPFRLKSGLLLPGLEGIDTAKEQISIACQKAGINPLKEKMVIYKFTAQKYQ